MKELVISSLFGDEYPFASFHDGYIKTILLDYVKQEAAFRCVLCIGNADSDERNEWEATASGILTFSGLLFCVMEAPQEDCWHDDEKGLDVFREGPLKTAEWRAALPKLPTDLPDDAFVHYFYLNNCCSFLYAAATGARFDWD